MSARQLESLDGSGWPLVFPVGDAELDMLLSARESGRLRAAVRALEGMQKEALVGMSGRGVWRLVSDEGHYLNGTDLAPPPLDFFTAGMQFSVLAAVLRVARARGIPLRSVRLQDDNVYIIEGSFLRGDARGSAEPPRLRLSIEADADSDAILSLVRTAVRSAPALALARQRLENRFTLSIGNRRVALEGMREARQEHMPLVPGSLFERVQPADAPEEGIITKLSRAERVENDPHGAGVGLKAEQRRTIHVRGRSEWLGEERFRTDIELIRPIGSSFRFHADDGAEASAPPPEAFVVAGVAFCFMTQLGRYAAIRKREVSGYHVLQDNRFEITGNPAESDALRCTAQPFTTGVFLDTELAPEHGADLVRVSERTCYLHATMREPLEPRIELESNGKKLTVV